jgi:hypothetical protein
LCFLTGNSLSATDNEIEKSSEEYVLDYRNSLVRNGDYKQTRHIAEKLSALGVRANDDRLRARGLVRRAYADLFFGEYTETWHDDLKLAGKLCGEEESIARAEYLGFGGYIKGTWLHNFSAAIQDVNEGIRIANNLNADVLQAKLFGLNAQLWVYEKNLSIARDFAFRGMVIAELTYALRQRI